MFGRSKLPSDADELSRTCETLVRDPTEANLRRAWDIAEDAASAAKLQQLGPLQYIRIQACRFFIHTECDWYAPDFGRLAERQHRFWLNYELSRKCYEKIVIPQFRYISASGTVFARPISEEEIDPPVFNPFYKIDLQCYEELDELSKEAEEYYPESRDRAWASPDIKRVWNDLAPTISRWHAI